ncbi:TPA: hypothetical protein CPT89_00985 [Candidatus Gastranaerophilales bacterium HUM_11]|nr:MAG TPA: hypothetical protein CPT89_00985 [Candidatus Gastranaerophilales bacterium HUM_11]
MRGFPKHLNSKQDYLNCLQDYPAETKAALKQLLNNRFMWFDTAILDESQEGITDETHRVIESDDVKIQQELKEDSNARLFRLGFTVAEVEGLAND